MLIVTNSFQNTEMKALKKAITLLDIIKIAKKVQNGLGTKLLSNEKGYYIKIRYYTDTLALRSIFLFQNQIGDVVPILLRTKKDKIGYNMSFKNKSFCKELEKNLIQIEQDIINEKYEEYEI